MVNGINVSTVNRAALMSHKIFNGLHHYQQNSFICNRLRKNLSKKVFPFFSIIQVFYKNPLNLISWSNFKNGLQFNNFRRNSIEKCFIVFDKNQGRLAFDQQVFDLDP